MIRIIVILFLAFSYPVLGQTGSTQNILSDTSLYFIKSDSLNPVHLSPAELQLAEQLFVKAVKEFNDAQQRYADSVDPKKNKRKRQALRIDVNRYFFRLIPRLNNENQKIVWISGDCKDSFSSGKRKNPVYDKEWKRKFVDGNVIDDGGSCYIYLHINLTLKTLDRLLRNGEG